MTPRPTAPHEGPPVVAVNGRFLGRPVTGVERYATELLSRLPRALGTEPRVLRPGRGSSGVAGHLWEQAALPGRVVRSGADVLLSPCNLGPVRVARQVVVIHDVAPFRQPGSFSRRYGAQVRWVQRALARRCAVVTVSEHSRSELAEVLGIDRAGIGLVPPAVGPPFVGAAAERPRRRAVVVGGHDPRKNVGFLLELWPAVHAATGLELHVVARSGGDAFRRHAAPSPRGVRWLWDLADAELARLYRSATCVLSASRYEGFGLPLLEGMACGTPFLATATGAAPELAVAPDEQLLALDPAAWTTRLVDWAGRDLAGLRAASVEHAARWSWERSAALLAQRLREVAAQPPIAARSRRHRSPATSSTRATSAGSSTSTQ